MRTILLGDIGNRLDIDDAEKSISQVASKQRRTESQLRAKNVRIDRLTAELSQQKLAIQALTRFLVSKEMISEDELNAFIEKVDAEDGVIDGKMTLDPNKPRLIFD